MKNVKKIVLIIISIVMLSLMFTNSVFAEGEAIEYSSDSLSLDQIIQKGNSWANQGKNLVDPNTVVNKVLPIGQMLTAIGVAVVFGGIVILGIKYMISEPEQKGKLKQQLIGLVVSGIVIFGAYTIWNTFNNFFTQLFK